MYSHYDMTQPVEAPPPTKNPRDVQARINGSHSKGPTSTQGKHTCSRNALKHGLTAEKHAVLDIEDPAEFKLAYDAAIDEFRPKTVFALRLVEKLAHLDWRLERLAIIDTAYLNFKINEASGNNNLQFADVASEIDTAIGDLIRGWVSAASGASNLLELLRRYTATTQNQFNNTLAAIHKLETRQAAALRDRDLPYQKPVIPACEIHQFPSRPLAQTRPREESSQPHEADLGADLQADPIGSSANAPLTLLPNHPSRSASETKQTQLSIPPPLNPTENRRPKQRLKAL